MSKYIGTFAASPSTEKYSRQMSSHPLHMTIPDKQNGRKNVARLLGSVRNKITSDQTEE